MKFVRIIALKPLYTFLSGIRNKDGTVINMLFNSAAKNIVPETLSRKLFYSKDVILTIFYQIICECLNVSLNLTIINLFKMRDDAYFCAYMYVVFRFGMLMKIKHLRFPLLSLKEIYTVCKYIVFNSFSF